MTYLQKLKLKYPDCYYDKDFDCIMIIDAQGEPQTICEDANEWIEDHYEGEKMDCFTNSGNPEDMVLESVTGKEYVEGEFGGDYEDAFINI
jgi:hypothetical protein